MRRGYQLTLFGTESGKGQLFGRGVLDRYLNEHRTTEIPDRERRAQQVSDWLHSLASSRLTEASLEAKFLTDIFGDVLGYTFYPANQGPASLVPKPPSRLTNIPRTPDAMLGLFEGELFKFTVAVELKTPGTRLDVPQPRERSETPVEQGFYYGTHILGTRWVVVSDMKVLRLYSVESEAEYEEIRLLDCVDAQGRPTESFDRLWFLFHHDYLVHGHEASQLSLLREKSAARQLEIRDSFYRVYYEIRAVLYEAIRTASTGLAPVPNRQELLGATQRLLDRMLFIYYCEDHPQQLITHGTIEQVTGAASLLPGASDDKVYEFLKVLFREIDTGSPPASGVKVAGYNGELFKEDRILDNIQLPDSLHRKSFRYETPDGGSGRVQGVWGLHVFDFWKDLNEHLLGHIFEESLSDLADLGHAEGVSISEKLAERKRSGIYYTASVLSDFLAARSLSTLLDEEAPLVPTETSDLSQAIQRRFDLLPQLRIVDFACGSGAFLVSSYRELLQELWRLRSARDALAAEAGRAQADLLAFAETVSQAELLRECLYGMDILPQATEIAKLALWLRSARKGEKVPDLSHNIVPGNSLDLPEVFTALQQKPGSFDLVVGNPPWGGEIESSTYAEVLQYLNLPEADWDSWELFVVLGIRALREGGRLALVLPDSILYPAKERLRKILFEEATVEFVYNLGPDWFGKNVRMGTVLLQARRGPVNTTGTFQAALLAGDLRDQAIRAQVPLSQIESRRGRAIPIARVLASPTRELEVLRGVEDDRIMARMEAESLALGDLTEHGRGEEINKAGLLWICPSCMGINLPGAKMKGGRYKDKVCGTKDCDHVLKESEVSTTTLVEDSRTGANLVPFIDGDDVTRRYQSVTPRKWMRLGVEGWPYKPESLYVGPKLLIRQAGIGVVATLDPTDARCPQSMYVYRLKEPYRQEGYAHEFVLATLLSRTMAYFVFKRYAEVDPAKAHSKLTHQRLLRLPIPQVDFNNHVEKKRHDQIVDAVQALLAGRAVLGGSEDRLIEQHLRKLWGLSSQDGAYINGEFADVPDSQVFRDLFPQGVPGRV